MPLTVNSAGVLDGLLREAAPAVVDWRRHLHRHPEVSFREHRTAAYIAGQLSALGLDARQPTPTSVVADLVGTEPGRTIALRADIDALPVKEETGLSFASQVPGVMHACGHDGHTAALLGAAQVLSRAPRRAGNVRFVFQHGEEQMPKGAPELIAAGVLDGVDAIVGQHLMAHLPVGVIGINHGALMASSDAFSITFTGSGGHGGMPYLATDPIPAAADFVQATHRLAAREFQPQEPVVVSVTQVHAGDVYNVIPSTAVVGGTTRALTAANRTRLTDRVGELAHQVAALHGLTAEVTFDLGPPPVVNHPEVVDAVVSAVAGTASTVREVTPIMGGDDYAFYLEQVPGAYFFVGASPGENAFPHHHPRLDISEDALALATELLTRAALALCAPTQSR